MLRDRNLDIAESLSSLASELGTTAVALAVAWVRGRRGVTSVIIGPRTYEQYEQYMDKLDLQLDASVVHRLNEISRPAT
jgi:aryl-alcohol dehydrogenase-like predicted oxidoreductase